MTDIKTISKSAQHPFSITEITQQTPVLIQGITGKEGLRAAQWMINSGINIVAGVTPGKGGQTVLDTIPVYNSVAEAVQSHPTITMSSLYVPPRFVLGAALEAMDAGLACIHIFAEGVPSLDSVTILEKARQTNTSVVGPSSIGFAIPGVGAIGSMSGGDMTSYLSGDTGVAIISKSGGMANTIANIFSDHGIPQSLIIGIGGDRIIGTTYADILPALEHDTKTAAIVIVGEIGGAYEEMAAKIMLEQSISKPVVAFISGLFAETLPQGVAFGHAGAIVSKSEGTRASKVAALSQAGAHIATSPTQLVSIVQSVATFSN